jgi:Tol biopolymer transport system component/outer membrane protein assembly factor BamD (BamD/ComL family)
MKRVKVSICMFGIIVMVMSLGIFLGAANQKSAEELYEAALFKKDADGDMLGAIKLFNQIVEQYPNNRNIAAKALLSMGMCYEKLGVTQALNKYQDVINKYPEQRDEATAAKERLSYLEAYAANLSKRAEQHLNEGNKLFSRWEYESAIEEYKNAVNLNPNSPLALNARYRIGQSWFRTGKYDAALATFKKLIEENPESNIAPVTELMVAQVQNAMENSNPKVRSDFSEDENSIIDPETGITYRKIKTFTGKSDVITLPGSLQLSPNGKYLLCENTVVPMDGTAPFELIDYDSTGIQATRGTWAPDGTKAAFFSGDALCVVPVSPETGHTSGPLKKIHEVKLRWQSSPGWSPDGKKLTYYAGGDIWTIDADGSDLAQITKTDIREVGPAWSPDGKTIAYGIGTAIGLYSVEEGSHRKFADIGARCFPDWSPDGKWLLRNSGQKLKFYNLNDKSNFEITPPERIGRFFSWSSGGTKMLFFRSSYFDDSGLKIASSAGGPSFEPVPLLTNWGNTVWSDNSKLMAVQGDIAFRIVPLSGGESYPINLDNLVDGKPFPFSISSGLKKLLFKVDRDDGKEDLYVVAVSAEDARTTGPAVKIFKGWQRHGGAFNIIFSLSADGEKVALVHEGDIWIAFTNGNDPIRVTNTPEEEGYVKWLPDGKTLLFDTSSGWDLLKNPGQQGEIISLLDEGKEIECGWGNIDVSPNNSQFAVLSDEHIKIIPLYETKSSHILNLSELKLSQCFNLKWSPNGENLAFIGSKKTDDPISFPEGKYQIYIIPVHGGQPGRIAPDDDDFKDFLSWSPDGKWISYSPEKPVKVRPESTLWEADFEEVIEKLLQLE